MSDITHTVFVPESLGEQITAELARRNVSDHTAGVLQLVDEAIRMNRVPGIYFVNSREGRRAALAFSGLEIWEIIAFWKERGENWEVFRPEFEEFSEEQLRAALRYYELYPDEIDARLAQGAYWTPERIAAELPFTRIEVPATHPDEHPTRSA